MDIGTVFDKIGHLGQGQFLLVLPLYIICNLTSSTWALLNIFVLYTPSNDTSQPIFHSFLQDNPDVDHREWRNKMDSSYLIGVLIGASVFGIVSDKYGRYRTAIACNLFRSACGAALTLVSTVRPYLVLRFAAGFASIGNYMTAMNYLYEGVGPKKWIWNAVLSGVMWPVGELVLTGIAFLTKEWSAMITWCVMIGVIPTILLYKLPESPRWLYTAGYHDRAEAVFTRIGKLNGRDGVVVIARQPYEKNHRDNFLSMFKSGPLMSRMVVLMTISGVLTFVYYGIIFNIGWFGDNIFQSMFISCGFEFLACPVALLALKFFASQYAAILLSSFVIILLIPPLVLADGELSLLGLVVEQKTLSLCSAMAAKTCLSGIWYPTAWIRSQIS